MQAQTALLPQSQVLRAERDVLVVVEFYKRGGPALADVADVEHVCLRNKSVWAGTGEGQVAEDKPDLTDFWNGRFDRLEGKLERLVETHATIGSTLAAQHATLEEHVRRTTNVEARQEKFEAALVPLKQHVVFWAFLGKLLGALITAASVVGAVMKLMGR